MQKLERRKGRLNWRGRDCSEKEYLWFWRRRYDGVYNDTQDETNGALRGNLRHLQEVGREDGQSLLILIVDQPVLRACFRFTGCGESYNPTTKGHVATIQ